MLALAVPIVTGDSGTAGGSFSAGEAVIATAPHFVDHLQHRFLIAHELFVASIGP
jgi:hypothetical protein